MRTAAGFEHALADFKDRYLYVFHSRHVRGLKAKASGYRDRETRPRQHVLLFNYGGSMGGSPPFCFRAVGDSVMYTCPVCRYPAMRNPPCDFNICPCCGVEFGYEDANRSHEDLRAVWIESGRKWWSPVEAAPKDWDPASQL